MVIVLVLKAIDKLLQYLSLTMICIGHKFRLTLRSDTQLYWKLETLDD